MLSYDTGSCYPRTSNIRCSLVGNKTFDHTNVVVASPVGAAPITSSFSTKHQASMDWAKTTARRGGNHVLGGANYIRGLTVYYIYIIYIEQVNSTASTFYHLLFDMNCVINWLISSSGVSSIDDILAWLTWLDSLNLFNWESRMYK